MDYLHRTIDNQFDLLMDAFGAVLIKMYPVEWTREFDPHPGCGQSNCLVPQEIDT